MNIYLVAVVALLVLDYLVTLVIELLNLRHATTEIPDEFKGWYDPAKYRKAQDYLRDTTRFDLVSDGIMTPVYLAFILVGGFGWVDGVARSAGWGLVGTGLVFAGILVMAAQVIHLPFSWYSTFFLEERYGFNRTTVLTFLADRAKGLLLTALLGGAAFAALLWFFSRTGAWAWVYAWLVLILFQVVLTYIAPAFIMPLFNKFTPLPDGDLKEAIDGYAGREGFKLKGIFTMDGSRRSTKSNAYFTGFGRWRRIVLFDTLVEKHEVEELVSVLAHEVGHFKLRHIHRFLASAILSTGLMLFILSLFINRPGLYAAFGVPTTPVGGYPPLYAGMVFFGFLYSPIHTLLSLLQNHFSRKYEFQADRFAARTYGKPNAMIHALKKLAVDNLSNLTPHPLKVFWEYSHPPILSRIEALRHGPYTR